MNQSAIPTGISQSASGSNSIFTATNLHSAFRKVGAQNGSRLGKLDDSRERLFL